MRINRRRIREYFSSLEDGSLALTLWVLLAVLSSILIGALLQAPAITLAFSTMLFAALLGSKIQKERPRDSIHRVTGGLESKSFLVNPRFSGPMAAGFQNMGKRLWRPKWVTTAADVTNEGLRFDLDRSPFGLRNVMLPWSEMSRVCLRNTFSYTVMTIEGIGSTLIVRIIDFRRSGIPEMLAHNGVPVSKG